MVKILPTATIHYENWVKKYVQRHNHRVSHEKYQFLPFSMVFLNASVEAWPWVQSLGMRVCVRSRPQFPLSSLPSTSVVTAQQEQEGLLQSPGLCPDGTEMPNSFHVPWHLWTHWTGTAFPNSNQIQTRMQQEKKSPWPKGASSLPHNRHRIMNPKNTKFPVFDYYIYPTSTRSFSLSPSCLRHSYFSATLSGHQASHQWGQKDVCPGKFLTCPGNVGFTFAWANLASVAWHFVCTCMVQQQPPAASGFLAEPRE